MWGREQSTICLETLYTYIQMHICMHLLHTTSCVLIYLSNMYVQYTYINNVNLCNLYNIYIYAVCNFFVHIICMILVTLHIQLADLTFEQTELGGHLSMWKSSSPGICLVGDFLRIRVENHHFSPPFQGISFHFVPIQPTVTSKSKLVILLEFVLGFPTIPSKSH